jgi:DNA-binding LytR/AlgR family response regulator
MELAFIQNDFSSPIKNKKSVFDYSQVKYFSADINYTTVHFFNGVKRVLPYTIKRFEQFLTNDHNFIRIHRAYLVNRKYITELSDLEVLLCCGKRLPVARRRKVF